MRRRIDSLEGCGGYMVTYPPCSRCDEPDKEPGGGHLGDRPWVICAKCYIEWLTGE